MLMMTHTWLLMNYPGGEEFVRNHPDLLIYNICPDLLPIHKDITAEITHGIPRRCTLPAKYQKNAFVHFHLMVDDISHHGSITSQPVMEFNPDSQGYTYLKGRPLVQPLLEIYENQGTPIPYAHAAYRSHMIIEMTFDLALHLERLGESEKLLTLLSDAMSYTAKEKLVEFSENIVWLYGMPVQNVEEALREGAAVYTLKRIRRFMTLEGRIQLFAHKYGISRDDGQAIAGLTDVMNQGMELVKDYVDFLEPTLAAIRRVGFNPDL
ncbi:MAG: hypothetical protein WCJ37_04570 [Syntrophus sp. (in: bacteria)]